MKNLSMRNLFFLFLIVVSFAACKEDKPAPTVQNKPTPVKKHIKVPPFDVDYAYKSIQEQLAFGPRVPGTAAHTKAKDFLVQAFKDLGLTVTEQHFDGFSPEGKKYQGTNVIAAYKPKHASRILLASHWDSRYISDHDDKVKDKPVMGADDGASGVGIIFSVAKTLQEHPADIGIDFVLFDVEDQGATEGDDTGETWCQGSQYFSRNLPKTTKPVFGVLFDMVGAANAQFMKDEISMAYAGKYANKVWKLASNMGYSQYFLEGKSPGLIDDHLFVNRIARIPMIDIINRPTNNGNFEFGKHWHTQNDVLSVIDKSTLRAVGQTTTAVIYQASVGNF